MCCVINSEIKKIISRFKDLPNGSLIHIERYVHKVWNGGHESVIRGGDYKYVTVDKVCKSGGDEMKIFINGKELPLGHVDLIPVVYVDADGGTTIIKGIFSNGKSKGMNGARFFIYKF